jgi:hypothetical protein
MLCAWEKDDCASKGKNLVWLSPRHAVDACNRYQELGSISIAKGFILCSKLVRRRGQMLRNRQFEMRQPSRECSPVKFRECALINKEQLSLSSAMAKETRHARIEPATFWQKTNKAARLQKMPETGISTLYAINSGRMPRAAHLIKVLLFLQYISRNIA